MIGFWLVFFLSLAVAVAVAVVAVAIVALQLQVTMLFVFFGWDSFVYHFIVFAVVSLSMLVFVCWLTDCFLY